jgi:hypothetical protein
MEEYHRATAQYWFTRAQSAAELVDQQCKNVYIILAWCHNLRAQYDGILKIVYAQEQMIKKLQSENNELQRASLSKHLRKMTKLPQKCCACDTIIINYAKIGLSGVDNVTKCVEVLCVDRQVRAGDFACKKCTNRYYRATGRLQ